MSEVISLLEANGVVTWIFGGWAEELRGLVSPRPHADLDLLYPGEDFGAIDRLIVALALEEISAKRAAHKRAFRFRGVMVEIFLVANDDHGLHSMFWGQARHDWPADALSDLEGQRVAGVEALQSYRRAHERLRNRGPTAVAGRSLSAT